MDNVLRSALAIACAYCTLGIHAQSWCPPGAEWTFDHITDIAQQSGVVRVEYDGDTLLNGSTAQRLRPWRHVTQSGMNTYNTWPSAPFFTRSSNDVVELYHPTTQQFDTLMWFAAQPGQSWNLFGPLGMNVTINVISTSTVIVDGAPLRQLIISGTPAFHFGTDTLLERIGFHRMFIKFHETLALDPTVGSLRCYHDDGLEYSTMPLSECGFTVGMAPAPVQPEIQVFPNPGSERLTLSLPPGNHSITLFDATGRTVVQQRTSLSRVELTTRELRPGLFTYLVQDDHGALLGRGAWMKE